MIAGTDASIPSGSGCVLAEPTPLVSIQIFEFQNHTMPWVQLQWAYLQVFNSSSILRSRTGSLNREPLTAAFDERIQNLG